MLEAGYETPHLNLPPPLTYLTAAHGGYVPNPEEFSFIITINNSKPPPFHQCQHHRCDPSLLAVCIPILSLCNAHTHTHTPPPNSQVQQRHSFLKRPCRRYYKIASLSPGCKTSAAGQTHIHTQKNKYNDCFLHLKVF